VRIALDYDETYTLDPTFWRAFIHTSLEAGHDVRIVTARSPTHDNIDHIMIDRYYDIPVIYCDGVAKRFVCHHFEAWDPDIWIDDKPQAVDNNSSATREWLEEWRATRAS